MEIGYLHEFMTRDPNSPRLREYERQPNSYCVILDDTRYEVYRLDNVSPDEIEAAYLAHSPRANSDDPPHLV